MMLPSLRSLKAHRACDGCRRRKVKCDAAEACANCKVSHLPCQYTGLPKKRGPKIPRFRNNVEISGLSPHSTEVLALRDHVSVDEHQHWEPSVASQDDLQEAPEESRSPNLWRLTTTVDLTASVGHVQNTNSTRSARAIWDELLVLISSALPSMAVIDVVNYTIDLFMQYTFPTTPIVHEPTLRTDAFKFFSGTSHIKLFGSDEDTQRVTDMRAFTLITALCASVAAVMPDSLMSYRHLIAVPLINASRQMLKAYEDYDMEYPNSSSLSIRVLQSTALQSTTGKSGAAWHILGQACLLAQNMRLYSEEAIRRGRHNPTEVQLLRMSFWHLFSSDSLAASLRCRPFVLHETLFEEKMTVRPSGEHYSPLIDTSKPWYEKSFEDRLLASFQLVPRLWSSAATLISDMRTFENMAGDRERYKARLTGKYLDLTGIMDELPHWLHASNIMASQDDEEAVSFHKTSFWVQRCNIMTTFHLIKLVILQQCIDSGLCDMVGLDDRPLTLAIKKVEMIHEFLQMLEDMPFLYHRVKGEPSVERIRRFGITLLQVIQTVDNEAIKIRANSYFIRLLDILAKLDSKASDELGSNFKLQQLE